MATNTLQVNLLNDLKNEAGLEDVGSEKIHLTPYLALACAMLYMVASDGELGASESSHLQSVLGGDEEVLRYGVHFVQHLSFDGFLIDAPELLSMKDKWCILANVCDALLSDGHADASELAQFSRLKHAFGVQDKQFEPFFKILALKNDKSILGRYAGVRDERQPMTPHLAMACALLYMLTSDGSIGAQEVGQLEAVLGEFEGLQKVALSYVRTVKMKSFLDEASAILNTEQKLFILINVCDSMLADGEVASIEDKLFISILHAFGYNEAVFARFYQVIETKNVKPFSTSDFKNSVKHNRVASSDETEGELFENKLSDSALAAAADGLRDAEKGDLVRASAAELEMNQFISRQMLDNRQNLDNDFDGQVNFAKIKSNATDGLNLQPIVTAPEESNRQIIQSDALTDNHQLIESDGTNVNRQEVSVDGMGIQRETLDPEVRARNIHQAVGQVNQRLDHFEAKNLSFLQIGRTQKFTDDFVLIEEDTLGVNRQLLENAHTRMGLSVGRTHSEEGIHSSSAASSDSGRLDDQTTDGGQAVNQVGAPHENSENLYPQSGKSGVGLRLFSGDGKLIAHPFGFPYKQVAVALATIVFATPIYTRPAQSREVVGPLVVLRVPASDLSVDHTRLDLP